MRRFIPYLMISALIISCLVLTAAPARAEEEIPLVVMIETTGNSAVAAEEILAATGATRIGQPLDLATVEQDCRAIYDLGYFSEVRPAFRSTLGGVTVIFTVVEYPPLKEIKVAGLTRIPMDKALAVFTSKPGGMINRRTLAEDLHRLIVTARDEYGVLLSCPIQRLTADGVFEIELVEMRLRRLSFTGLVRTREEVVRREFSAQEGGIFDVRTFREDLYRLLMKGYFEPSVAPAITPVPEAADLIDVTLAFTERRTGSYGGNITINKEAVLGGLFIGDTNYLGTGNSYRVEVMMNQDNLNGDITLSLPWLDEHRTSLDLHLYSRSDEHVAAVDPADNTVLAAESMRGCEIRLGRPLGENWSVSLSGRYQYLDRTTVDAWTDPAPVNPLPLTDGPLVTNSLGLHFDYADLTPQEYGTYVQVGGGMKAGLQVESAGGLLGGDVVFTRYSMDAALFASLSNRAVLGLRVMGGFVDAPPGGDPFATANFYSGGPTTLRAYDYNTYVSTGMLLVNTEFRYRLSDAIEGVVFYDFGNFYNPSGGWETGAGYGAGLRVWLPVFNVQLRMDYAWPTDGGGPNFTLALGEMF